MSLLAPAPESRVVIRNLSWRTYETLLRERGDEGPRMAYDRGVLEIMSPSFKHESLKKLLARLIETFSLELGIEIRSAGSTTFKIRLKERGLEPDESYYVQNEERSRGKEIDLASDPPPDLAIEIDLQHSAIDKLGVYAALGVPEVWSHDGARVVIHLLRPSGEYVEGESSAAFPQLPVGELHGFLERIDTDGETQVVRSFRAWIRELFGVR
jgi:Uma2 family endonuclease